MKKSFLRSQSGMAAIEAAFILPLMSLIYFSMIDVVELITSNRRMTSIASTVSDTISQYQTTIQRATVIDIFNAKDIIMPTATQQANVHVDVYGYYMKNGAPTPRWNVGNGIGPACNAPDTTGYAALMAGGNDIIVSVSCMTYSPVITQFMGSNLMGSTSFVINQSIVSRLRSTPTLTCMNGAAVCTS